MDTKQKAFLADVLLVFRSPFIWIYLAGEKEYSTPFDLHKFLTTLALLLNALCLHLYNFLYIFYGCHQTQPRSRRRIVPYMHMTQDARALDTYYSLPGSRGPGCCSRGALLSHSYDFLLLVRRVSDTRPARWLLPWFDVLSHLLPLLSSSLKDVPRLRSRLRRIADDEYFREVLPTFEPLQDDAPPISRCRTPPCVRPGLRPRPTRL